MLKVSGPADFSRDRPEKAMGFRGKVCMFEAAIDAFRQVVGEEHTVTGAAELERYRWCTIPVERDITAVLRPGSVEEVRQLVRIAGLHQVALYPISTGNNWGYGAAHPAR